MYKYIFIKCIAVFLTAALSHVSFSQMDHAASEDFLPVLLEDMEWSAYQPPGFAPELMITVMYGDPSVPDKPYVLRASFPDGYIDR
jgi:hypothetical protein